MKVKSDHRSREERGAAECFKILKCLYNSTLQESEEIVRAAACDVKRGLHAPTLLYSRRMAVARQRFDE